MNKHIYKEFEYDTKQELLDKHKNVMCKRHEPLFDETNQKEIGKRFVYIDLPDLIDKELEELKKLRRTRNKECFSIINRGALWYEGLTEAQKTELKIWYQAWLKVTETKVIPDKPSWV